MNHFDVLIIGGGHAGVEAAWAANQFNLQVGIVTLPEIGLASTPCNPAVGGVGKGQVVREIDALGGLIGRIADLSGIQYRTLNESKGYAVHSTRAQVDKDLYTANAEKIISEETDISVIRNKVESISKEDDVFKVSLDNGEMLWTQKLIMTTGTFLGGTLHTGDQQTPGGRVDASRSNGLNELFKKVSTLPKRFKTGTPARLDAKTLDFGQFDEQESDFSTENFHLFHFGQGRLIEQTSCYLTRTNEDTLGIIRDNKERSPIFNGQIKGIGPRYCPSIEDKAFRYPDRNSHHVFIEPEGLSTDSIYPNGVSTSLPKEVQLEFLRTIPGLEKCEILVHGYAVEYDVVDTTKLNLKLEYQEIPGLFFAGQVNGTSGYEEAAGQGLIAGLNAGLDLVGKMPLILDRKDSYIGVMIEDLVTEQRDEPYRLFTARAEGRLYIREDNTVQRIAPYRLSLGLDKPIDNGLKTFLDEYNLLLSLVNDFTYSAKKPNREHFKEMDYGDLQENITLKELLKRSHLDPFKTLKQELEYFGAAFSMAIVKSVAISVKYEGYITRATRENDRMLRLEKKQLNWEKLIANTNISNECRQRIEAIKPETFGQLQRMKGIRPATLAFVAGNLV